MVSGIVDYLEAVEVNKNDAEFSTGFLCDFYLVLDARLELRAIGQAG